VTGPGAWWARERLGGEPALFAMLGGLALFGGIVALFVVPVRAEHEAHVAAMLAGFLVYRGLLLAVLLGRSAWAREIFLATLAADLGLVFLLTWFAGWDSHFYLLYYVLVALNAYQFGPGIGAVTAALAAVLLALAAGLTLPAVPWAHVGARTALLGLLGLALGHVAARERQARARAERLHHEREAALARLAEVEQLAAVGRLSAKMAHEVRNPLGAITLNADMLGDLVQTCPGPAMREARELLQEIRDEVSSLAALADEYLAAARLRRPRLEKDYLNDVVADLTGFMSPLAGRLGVRVELALEESLPPLPIDRGLVRQAAQNLLKNSLEMLPAGGRVTLTTRRTGDVAVLAVADDGPGVDPEVGPRLFEPFFTTKAGGTGLGLAIAREIARAHGGDVGWRNRPEGGAEFELRLPFARHGDE
jgi:two-component system, NtrC family, sensor kinase